MKKVDPCILDFIQCNFEFNLCQWTNEHDDEKYVWFRNTSNGLATANIPGPPTDLWDKTDKYFVMTSNYMANDVLPGQRTILTSPYFLGQDHPSECFSFWFYMGRGGAGQTLSIRIQEDGQICTDQLVWSLDDSYVDTNYDFNVWHHGELEFHASDRPDSKYRVCK